MACHTFCIIVCKYNSKHYDDVVMGAMASQITSLTIVYSTVYSGADQRKHQSSASLAIVQGIHRGPVNSHKWPVTRKMSPFDGGIMRDLVITVSADFLGPNAVRPSESTALFFWYNSGVLLNMNTSSPITWYTEKCLLFNEIMWLIDVAYRCGFRCIHTSLSSMK